MDSCRKVSQSYTWNRPDRGSESGRSASSSWFSSLISSRVPIVSRVSFRKPSQAGIASPEMRHLTPLLRELRIDQAGVAGLRLPQVALGEPTELPAASASSG